MTPLKTVFVFTSCGYNASKLFTYMKTLHRIAATITNGDTTNTKKIPPNFSFPNFFWRVPIFFAVARIYEDLTRFYGTQHKHHIRKRRAQSKSCLKQEAEGALPFLVWDLLLPLLSGYNSKSVATNSETLTWTSGACRSKKKNRLALAAYAKPTGKNIKSGEKKRMVPKSKLSKGVRAMNNRVLLLLFLTLHTTRKGSACFVLSTELRALFGCVERFLSFIYLRLIYSHSPPSNLLKIIIL